MHYNDQNWTVWNRYFQYEMLRNENKTGILSKNETLQLFNKYHRGAYSKWAIPNKQRRKSKNKARDTNLPWTNDPRNSDLLLFSWKTMAAAWCILGECVWNESRIRWQADVATKPPWTARQNVTEALIAVVVTSWSGRGRVLVYNINVASTRLRTEKPQLNDKYFKQY